MISSPEPLISSFATVALGEIRQSFEQLGEQYPPILDLDTAAELAGIAPSTLKRHVSEGLYKECVSRRKPLRFWRDRFCQEVMRDKPRKSRKQEGKHEQDEGDETR